MFLHQKFNYEADIITNDADFENLVMSPFKKEEPKIMMFDTETSGLNFMRDTPFLMTFGWGKHVFAIDLLKENSRDLVSQLYLVMARCKWVFAHNMKYDYHMMFNYGMPIPDYVNIADSQTIARMTNFSDEVLNKSLETMGVLYVDRTSKFAKDVIKNKISALNKVRKAEVKKWFIETYPKLRFPMYWELFEKRIPFVTTEFDEVLNGIGDRYKPANYQDVYNHHPNLMINYAYDDIVIMIEWIAKAIPVLKTVDPTLTVFRRESELIVPTAEQERVGLGVDVPYLLKSRMLIVAYRDDLYNDLYTILGRQITVGQHKEITSILANKYNVIVKSVDRKTLVSLLGKNPELDKLIKAINKLRTIDKWLSTYVDGLLKKVLDNRVYTSIDLSGTVSGRVSSDMQQQPKKSLDDVDGNEIYHPRRAIINDEGYKLFFFDYSQQELRVQAYYTLLTSTGDEKLLRAYMPFKCTSMITGAVFDYKDSDVLARWNTGEWLDEKDEVWKPTDVHAETTFKAFPHLNDDPHHPEFDKLRKLGKMCNFLKNYQGGVDAIIEQLDVSPEIAELLDKAYYKAFPLIKKYQQWVTAELHKVGHVEGLFGRRYYMKNSGWFYKAGNYLVQGSSADMIKVVELRVSALLKGTRSSFVMPVHDEIIVRIHNDEEYLVPKIKAIMEDVPEVPWVPMVAEVEWTSTNWADKQKGVD